jgi:hypothetical protein
MTDRDCPLCRERGKTWKGSDPTCAFEIGRPFSTQNWCCATMAALRGACEETAVYSDEEYVGAVPIPELCERDGELRFTHIVLSWYKHRGRTSGATVVDSEGGFHPLTLGVADAVARSLILRRDDQSTCGVAAGRTER